MDAVEQELAYAIADYVRSMPRAELARLCEAAEAWFDGAASQMHQFARNQGRLGCGADYAQLAAEAHKALAEVSGDHEHWRAPLLALGQLGNRIHYFDWSLRRIASLSTELVTAGYGDEYITSVAAHARAEGRAARRGKAA